MMRREDVYDLARAEGLPAPSAQVLAAAVPCTWLSAMDEAEAVDMVRKHIEHVSSSNDRFRLKWLGIPEVRTDPDAYMLREA